MITNMSQNKITSKRKRIINDKIQQQNWKINCTKKKRKSTQRKKKGHKPNINALIPIYYYYYFKKQENKLLTHEKTNCEFAGTKKNTL